MTNLRRTLATLTLLFALAAPTFAGNIHAGVASPDPTPAPTTESSTTQTAATSSTQAGEPTSAPDPALASVVEAALAVVQSILSII